MFTFMAFSLLGSVIIPSWSANLGLIQFYGLGLILAGIAAGIGYVST
jgi:hypothetical protein